MIADPAEGPTRPLRLLWTGIFVHFVPRFFAVFRDNFTFMRYNVLS